MHNLPYGFSKYIKYNNSKKSNAFYKNKLDNLQRDLI